LRIRRENRDSKSTRKRCEPSAMRMPISRVRCSTVKATVETGPLAASPTATKEKARKSVEMKRSCVHANRDRKSSSNWGLRIT
jgi:hypothetical protein